MDASIDSYSIIKVPLSLPEFIVSVGKSFRMKETCKLVMQH